MEKVKIYDVLLLHNKRNCKHRGTARNDMVVAIERHERHQQGKSSTGQGDDVGKDVEVRALAGCQLPAYFIDDARQL